MGKRKGGKGKHPGLLAYNFPKSVAWRVDQDYLAKLTPEEREWLGQFNDAYYGGSSRAMDELDWSREEKRKAYGDKNAANRDIYTQNEAVALPKSLGTKGEK